MDILEDIKKKGSPFKVPEHYFSTVEDGVRGAINEPEMVQSPFLSALKSGFALAFSFLLIFGMGYGVLSLTRTADINRFTLENDTFTTLMEQGYIKHDFIDYLYHEIEIQGEYLTSEMELYDELYDIIESEISEEELMNIIENEDYE